MNPHSGSVFAKNQKSCGESRSPTKPKLRFGGFSPPKPTRMAEGPPKKGCGGGRGKCSLRLTESGRCNR